MEGMKRPNVVSFLDWRNKVGDYSGLKEKNREGDRDWERIGSGLSLVSACGGESDGDLRMFRESTRSPTFKDVVSQPNGRWGAQIYEKHQQIWVGEDACDIEGVKFRGVFKPVEGGHLQNRFLSDHSKVETMDVTPKRQFEDHLDHSKITASTVAAHSYSHAPFGMLERVDEPVKLQQHKEVKRGEGMEKSESPWEKDKSVREPMFEKAVTPSDVGKLNRLVIPKHHAEKYFPLDTNANDKGLLLNFEDNTGKAWRFRYSYWNSSQSYVLTKGWSRFVKEKKLDAGDIVSFERSTDGQNAERLFISWKRRPCALQIQPGSKASLLRRLSLPSLAASPSFQYGPFQSQTLIRAASSSKAIPEWMSVVWPPNNGGALWRLPTEASSAHQPLPLSHNIHFLAAEEQNSVREPHDFMQLKPSELSTGDRSSPVENAAAISSKKGVRLFGVNL